LANWRKERAARRKALRRRLRLPVLGAIIALTVTVSCRAPARWHFNDRAQYRWTPEAACATHAVIERCLRWMDDNGHPEIRDRFPKYTVSVRAFPTVQDGLDAGLWAHENITMADEIILMWLDDDDDQWPGRALCHAMAHWVWGDHDSMDVAEYPWPHFEIPDSSVGRHPGDSVPG